MLTQDEFQFWQAAYISSLVGSATASQEALSEKGIVLITDDAKRLANAAVYDFRSAKEELEQ